MGNKVQVSRKREWEQVWTRAVGNVAAWFAELLLLELHSSFRLISDYILQFECGSWPRSLPLKAKESAQWQIWTASKKTSSGLRFVLTTNPLTPLTVLSHFDSRMFWLTSYITCTCIWTHTCTRAVSLGPFDRFDPFVSLHWMICLPVRPHRLVRRIQSKFKPADVYPQWVCS